MKKLNDAFLRGFSCIDPKNPYLLSSDNSGFWLLGKHFAAQGLKQPGEVRKSRGNLFIADGQKYNIEWDMIEKR